MRLKLTDQMKQTLKTLARVTSWIAAVQVAFALALVWDIYFGAAMQSPVWMRTFKGDPIGHAQILIILSLVEIAVLAATRHVLSRQTARALR